MRRIFFPPMKGYIVIETQVVLNSMERLPFFGRCFIRPKLSNGKKITWGEGKWIQWVLEPGEWWPIGSVWYPRKFESSKYFDLPIISLNIHRSFAKRKWVKDKLAQMCQHNFGVSTYSCTERNITCSTSDLNGKVLLAPDRETALIYSKKVLQECQEALDPQTSRFRSLLLEGQS